GPWTDVYGIGASIFACLAAFAPQAADARVTEDHLVSAKKIWAGAYSENLLEVIDWCLKLDPLERPQSVFALQKAIRDIPPRRRNQRLRIRSNFCRTPCFARIRLWDRTRISSPCWKRRERLAYRASCSPTMRTGRMRATRGCTFFARAG